MAQANPDGEDAVTLAMAAPRSKPRPRLARDFLLQRNINPFGDLGG